MKGRVLFIEKRPEVSAVKMNDDALAQRLGFQNKQRVTQKRRHALRQRQVHNARVATPAAIGEVRQIRKPEPDIVPVPMPEPGALVRTVAVKVTVFPTADGFRLDRMPVVVAAGLTT